MGKEEKSEFSAFSVRLTMELREKAEVVKKVTGKSFTFLLAQVIEEEYEKIEKGGK